MMISWKTLGLATSLGSAVLLAPSTQTNRIDTNSGNPLSEMAICYVEKGCVFRTLYGEELSDGAFVHNTPARVTTSINAGLEWIVTAQQRSGGWGAGSHNRQDIMDPHAVKSDPATTSMVAMALLRTGTRPNSGKYADQLNRATAYLLQAVESTPADRATITDETYTQIQSKLGANIDAALTLQFFSNLMEYLEEGSKEKQRVLNAMNICTQKIQSQQGSDGSIAGDGWAGVLQSAYANNALESAKLAGAEVDDDALDRSREYQKGNYDAESETADVSRGAGIALYSVSGSVRASAQQARKAKERLEEAKKDGIVEEDRELNEEVLMDIGFSREEAMKLNSSYKVYESSKRTAQRDDVMQGFGNNGGEEFLSYLQTGESLIINKDEEWLKWYENISGRLVNIQNDDGSWNGHHCITSPVFCTATSLLTLSINNDKEKLLAIGAAE